MAKTQILDYNIRLSDKTVVDNLNAALRAGNTGNYPTGAGAMIFVPKAGGPDTQTILGLPVQGERMILRAPYNAGPPEGGAAVEFAVDAGLYPPALPIVEVGDATPADGNYLDSPWFTSSNDFPRNVQTFQRSSGWWIFGSNTRFYWAGRPVYSPAPAGPGVGPANRVTLPARIRQRYWIDGAESSQGGDGSNSQFTDGGFYAGRHVGSYGSGLITNSGATNVRDHLTYPAGTKSSHERLYIRFFPGDASCEFWLSEYAAAALSGPMIDITALGQFALYSRSGGVKTLQGTVGQLATGVWTRVDLVNCITGSVAPSDWECSVYVNGVLLTSFHVSMGGLFAFHYMTSSKVGKQSTPASSSSYHLDTWVSAKAPYVLDTSLPTWDVGTPYLTGDHVRLSGSTYRAVSGSTGVNPATDVNNVTWQLLSHSTDWLNGSRVVNIYATGDAATRSGWNGPWQQIVQRPVGQSNVTEISSTTALANAHFTADIIADAESTPGAIGWNSFAVQPYSRKGINNGTVGYKLGAAAPVMQAVVEQNFLFWATPQHIYTPAADIAQPQKGTPVELHFIKGNDANSAGLGCLTMAVELCGVFGLEDVPANTIPGQVTQPAPAPEIGGLQNGPYNRSPWVTAQRPFAPVILKTGTYTGNGTGQDLAFPAPVVLFFTRPATAGAQGARWWTSMAGPHRGVDQGTGTGNTCPVQARQDFAFASGGPGDDQQMRFLIRLAGSGVDSGNQNAVAYHYFAIMDPAGRFFRAGALGAAPGPNLPLTHVLDDPNFTALFAWLYKEQYSTSAVSALFQKSQSDSVDEMRLSSTGAATANALTFGAGSLIARTGLVNDDAMAGYPYFLIRRDDGNPGLDVRRVVHLGSYTGDGTASRTISLDMNGRRPMWAWFMGQGGIAHYRDTGHTGANSRVVSNGSDVTTAITGGGIDSISVGSTLNTNGVVFSYVVIPGSATAGSGGWSAPSEEVPVPSDSPMPPDWDEPFEVLPSTVVVPVTPPDDMTTDLAVTCEPSSRALANKALSALGVTTLIGNLSTEQSREAEQVRLHWGSAVEESLRRHPWGFAKRYATLDVVAGTVDVPYNEDWHFAYRLPAKCVRVRRVVNEAVGRQFEKDPPHFAASSDDTSDTIQSNALLLTDHVIDETATPLQVKIEYTHRVNCPAGSGDALYRRALMWKLAELIGPGLSREADLVNRCAVMFERTLAEGAAVTTDERQLPPAGEASWITDRD